MERVLWRLLLPYLERAVVFLQLPAQTLQLAASQDGLAVLVPQRVLLQYHLVLLLLQRPHLLLGVAVHLQLSPASTRQVHRSGRENFTLR